MRASRTPMLRSRATWFGGVIVGVLMTAAGLAPGTFYHYFDSKEQIFREVAEAQEERLTAPPEDGSDADHDDAAKRGGRRRAARRSRGAAERTRPHRPAGREALLGLSGGLPGAAPVRP